VLDQSEPLFEWTPPVGRDGAPDDAERARTVRHGVATDGTHAIAMLEYGVRPMPAVEQPYDIIVLMVRGLYHAAPARVATQAKGALASQKAAQKVLVAPRTERAERRVAPRGAHAVRIHKVAYTVIVARRAQACESHAFITCPVEPLAGGAL
jgi:hypothetical protein